MVVPFELADSGHLLADELFVGGDDFVDELLVGCVTCSGGSIGFEIGRSF